MWYRRRCDTGRVLIYLSSVALKLLIRQRASVWAIVIILSAVTDYTRGLIKSLGPQRTWINSFRERGILLKSHFVPVSSASLVYFSEIPIHAVARVTSGACTRSCNPWKIINTRSLRLLLFSLSLTPSLSPSPSPALSLSSICAVKEARARARARSVWCVINDHAGPRGVLFRYSNPSPTQARLNNAISLPGNFLIIIVRWDEFINGTVARSDTVFFFFFCHCWLMMGIKRNARVSYVTYWHVAYLRKNVTCWKKKKKKNEKYT